MKPFDRDAQARAAALFRTCSPEYFLSEIDQYFPRTGPEQVAFHKFRGWGLYDGGEYVRARPDLLRALRWSEAGSNDRSLLHGLLAESYLRVGEYPRAERCTRRALFEGCASDPDHYLEAGHLHALARVHEFSGHITQVLDTCSRALTLIDSGNTHWTTIHVTIALAHLYRGDLEGADAAIQEARKAQYDGKQQAWTLASAEVPLAIATGDIDRADEAIQSATRTFFDVSGERVHHLLHETQAMVLHARGRYQEAEALLRGILADAVLGGRNSDAVGSASRVLTQCLMAQDRYEEALEFARIAIRGGRVDYRSEWVTGLRLLGESLEALGDSSGAQRALREAMSLHACMQFDAERKRLERCLDRTGSGRTLPVSASALGPARQGGRVCRVPLRSGRVFISCDPKLLDEIRAAAGTELPVLIEGETGTGKELIAQLIHELGPRSRGPLIVVDCTSLPETLADAELFGAARGAYTGAVERAGLIVQADRGTLVLDELPELAPSQQAKLLRVIQEGTFRRVGEDRFRRVQIRFVATTNRNTQRLLETGALKPDLFFRLSGHQITLSPLRSRREEIGTLATEFAKRSGLSGAMFDAISLLEAEPWPGNVRQLEMIVRLAASACRAGTMLARAHLEPHLRSTFPMPVPEATQDPRGVTLRAQRLAAERALLEQVLAASDGVVARAARSLRISRQSFYKAMRRAGL